MAIDPLFMGMINRFGQLFQYPNKHGRVTIQTWLTTNAVRDFNGQWVMPTTAPPPPAEEFVSKLRAIVEERARTRKQGAYIILRVYVD